MTEKEFKTIFDAHFEAIRSYLFYRSGDVDLATDLAQDAFMTLWEKKLIKDRSSVQPLLYKIAGNLFVNHYRRQSTGRRIQAELRFEIQVEEDPGTQLEYEETKQMYEKSLAQLSEKQRVVYLMNRLDGFTYPEIAERLAISVKTVEKRISQSLAHIRKVLQHR